MICTCTGTGVTWYRTIPYSAAPPVSTEISSKIVTRARHNKVGERIGMRPHNGAASTPPYILPAAQCAEGRMAVTSVRSASVPLLPRVPNSTTERDITSDLLQRGKPLPLRQIQPPGVHRPSAYRPATTFATTLRCGMFTYDLSGRAPSRGGSTSSQGQRQQGLQTSEKVHLPHLAGNAPVPSRERCQSREALGPGGGSVGVWAAPLSFDTPSRIKQQRWRTANARRSTRSRPGLCSKAELERLRSEAEIRADVLLSKTAIHAALGELQVDGEVLAARRQQQEEAKRAEAAVAAKARAQAARDARRHAKRMAAEEATRAQQRALYDRMSPEQRAAFAALSAEQRASFASMSADQLTSFEHMSDDEWTAALAAASAGQEMTAEEHVAFASMAPADRAAFGSMTAAERAAFASMSAAERTAALSTATGAPGRGTGAWGAGSGGGGGKFSGGKSGGGNGGGSGNISGRSGNAVGAGAGGAAVGAGSLTGRQNGIANGGGGTMRGGAGGNGRGQIPHELRRVDVDWSALMRALPVGDDATSEQRREELFASWDVNGNGVLSFNEVELHVVHNALKRI